MTTFIITDGHLLPADTLRHLSKSAKVAAPCEFATPYLAVWNNGKRMGDSIRGQLESEGPVQTISIQQALAQAIDEASR